MSYSSEIPAAHYELTQALHDFLAATQDTTTTQFEMFGAARFLPEERKAAFMQ